MLKVAKLELVHSLINLPNIPPVIFTEKCRLMNDEELYVHRDSVTSYADINRELARYFSCTGARSHSPPDAVLQQSSHCMSQLKSVCSRITFGPFIAMPSLVMKDQTCP